MKKEGSKKQGKEIENRNIYRVKEGKKQIKGNNQSLSLCPEHKSFLRCIAFNYD